MNGLAAQGAGRPAEMGIPQDMLKQVVELLKGGVSPQELMAQGVPVEVIDAAMAMLSQEAMAAQQMQGQQEMTGLAAQGMGLQ